MWTLKIGFEKESDLNQSRLQCERSQIHKVRHKCCLFGGYSLQSASLPAEARQGKDMRPQRQQQFRWAKREGNISHLFFFFFLKPVDQKSRAEWSGAEKVWIYRRFIFEHERPARPPAAWIKEIRGRIPHMQCTQSASPGLLFIYNTLMRLLHWSTISSSLTLDRWHQRRGVAVEKEKRSCD